MSQTGLEWRLKGIYLRGRLNEDNWSAIRKSLGWCGFFVHDFLFSIWRFYANSYCSKIIEGGKNQGDNEQFEIKDYPACDCWGFFFIAWNKICPSVIELSPLYHCCSEEQGFEYTRSFAACSWSNLWHSCYWYFSHLSASQLS